MTIKGQKWELVDEDLQLYRLIEDSADWFYINNFLPNFDTINKDQHIFKQLVENLKWSNYKSRWHCPLELDLENKTDEFNAVLIKNNFVEMLNKEIEKP
eukprot:UN01425